MADWNDLEIFEDVNRRLGRKLITISKRKMITLNSGFAHSIKDVLRNNDFVILGISRTNKAIVLRFTNNKDEAGAIKLIKGLKEDFSTVQISAGAFFNHLEFPLDEIAGRYEPEVIETPKGKGWALFFDKVIK